MTFLGWMHRKFMHNSTEPMKNSTLGNPCTCFSVQTLFDEQNYYVETTKTMSHSNMDFRKSSNRYVSNKVESLVQEESYESFEFLAIGTLGMELNTAPPTPTFPVPPENLTDQQIEMMTEDDLKLINYELEKFLEVEEKEIINDTSARSSKASIVTLSSKPIEGARSEDHTYLMACPLQSYLFATSVEVTEPDKKVKKEKTSLEELFKRSSIAHDDPTGKSSGAKQQPRNRSVARFMKKVVKKFHSSSSCSTDYKNEANATISAKKKLSKALKMLQRKVHPENVIERQFFNIQKCKKTDMPHENNCRLGANEENEMVQSEKNTRKLYSSGVCKSSSKIDGGHWIKTDSDYLVLEL